MWLYSSMMLNKDLCCKFPSTILSLSESNVMTILLCFQLVLQTKNSMRSAFAINPATI